MGAGAWDLPETSNGRIISLVPAKRQAQFRLSDQTLETLQQLADRLGKPRPDIVDLALTHLDGTLRNGEPVHILPPPHNGPKAHKKRRRAA